MAKFISTCFLLFYSIILFIPGHASANDVRIGVLSVRGPEDAKKYWQQVSDHLNEQIPEHHFVIVPLIDNTMEKAVADEQLEFVVVNPAEYINFEVKYGVSRIATLISHVRQFEASTIGAVIFTRADRTDISTLSDLKGKSLITATKAAFASWMVTRDELKRQGVSESDLASVQAAGASADKAVMAVKNGKFDAGAVRTGVLEQLANEGKIALSDFRILNQKHVEGFPFLLSSELYPDFAFARLKHTDKALATKVSAQLLLIPHDKPDSRYPNPIGWTVPDNYEKVRKLMQDWKLPPYENYGKVTLKEAIRQHWVTTSLAITAFTAVFLVMYLSLNIKQRKKKYRILQEAKQKLDLIHAMIVSTPDAVFIKDQNSRYVFVNPEAIKLFGMEAAEILGKDPLELFSPEVARTMMDYDNMVMSSAHSITYEKLFVIPDGTRYMLVTKGPMYDDNGAVDGVFAACRDITDIKQLHKEIAEKVVELETALSKVQQLEGIIPICSYCKKIRDDKESWHQMESYISSHSEALFSHGICPECLKSVTKEIENM